MSDYKVDTIIIGAGVVGLAIAEILSRSSREVIVLESEDDFGKITSSRNSGVIHAGIYYSEKSLKSKFCVQGNKLLYEYCKKNNIPYINTKKILVASYLLLTTGLEIILIPIPIIRNCFPFKLISSCKIPQIFLSLTKTSFGHLKEIFFFLQKNSITSESIIGFIIENSLNGG